MHKIEEFGNSSSIHGIKYVLTLKSSKAKRTIWLIAIFCSMCGFSYYVHIACRKLMTDPDTVMTTTDRKSSDFPAPAITICPGLFAKMDSVNFSKALYVIDKEVNSNFSKLECEYLIANFHWCDPINANKFTNLSCNDTNLNQSVVELITKSAYRVKDFIFGCVTEICQSQFSQVFTDFGFCFTWNSLSFSSIFNTETIHDDFKCYLRMENKTHEKLTNWSPEKGYESVESHFPLRAQKTDLLGFAPQTFLKERNNMCLSSSYRIYLHKPNEIMTPSDMIEFLHLGEVRNC
jgi:hypothetical protein